MLKNKANCAECPFRSSKRLCNNEDGKGLEACPTLHRQETLEQSMQLYDDPDTRKFAQTAASQEGAGYHQLGGDRVAPAKPRILEIAEFAGKMGYKRLGLIFCEGLVNEARAVNKYYSSKGYEMVSAACKAGRIPKEQIGIDDGDKIHPGKFEPMCNPIFQARLLNEEKVEFNIIMGLCVGHDSLVIKHLEAPVTILAVKDRLLGHNPLAAVYNLDSYYAFLK